MKKQRPQTQLGRPVNEHARQERINQILDGARRCFVERGFHASSTAQISAAAGVSVANLYQYFPTKEALIAALIEVDLERHAEMISRVWETDLSPQGIKKALEGIFLTKEGHAIAVLRAEIASEGGRNPEVADLLRRSEASLFALLRRSILQAQNAGRVSPDLDPVAVGERLSLVFEGVMRLYVFSPADGESLLDRYYSQLGETLGRSP
ncbi:MULTISPECIES: TetR/AcrR family transcriptional regulator [Agrobacterium]|uniref:TetR/AcrR family transcriptional regulator n=1 Tax=Agrobacterium TaxID=357 RepID=UPI001877C693|nr:MULTISPECIES: TetR/AcrR family transcriptional regulator [Agrobacterium]MDH0874050.1 TetR/AcrR family transcriptional regulator [Agrobacterium pusense]